MRSSQAVACPTCRRRGNWLEGGFLPFCSQRCKLIDLGKWFRQEHAISEPLRAEHLEHYADLPTGAHLDQPDHE